MIADCGATAVLVDAAEHDAAVALTSHIPQLLSTALAAYLDEHDVTQFAGGGLATFLRLARSDASVWLATLRANRGNIEPHIDAIVQIVREMLDGDATAFDRAKSFLNTLG